MLNNVLLWLYSRPLLIVTFLCIIPESGELSVEVMSRSFSEIAVAHICEQLTDFNFAILYIYVWVDIEHTTRNAQSRNQMCLVK